MTGFARNGIGRWPPTKCNRKHPLHIRVRVPHPPIYIQNSPKCTCICTCTYLSVDRPPNKRVGP
jgi:hypothetical protein